MYLSWGGGALCRPFWVPLHGLETRTGVDKKETGRTELEEVWRGGRRSKEGAKATETQKVMMEMGNSGLEK